MSRKIEAFNIKVRGKILDYRLGRDLDLNSVKIFFQRKKYKVKKLYSGGRHVLGELERRGIIFFLKLATTEGISAVTRIEYDWNEVFNKQIKRKSSDFWVPIIYDKGQFQNLFYIITDKFDGHFLSPMSKKGTSLVKLRANIDKIIEFSKLIQELQIKDSIRSYSDEQDFRIRFLNKSKSWLHSIPEAVAEEYSIPELFDLVIRGIEKLEPRPRHGDFTPWHIIKLTTGKLGLIDGEHAMAESVENYDICFFLQRVFSVLEEPELAQEILERLLKNDYEIDKLKVIVVARAIGGFLDESLKKSPNYSQANKFKNWTLSYI